MRRWIGVLLSFGVMTSLADAQNQPSPEQLQTMYQDALNQLKAAQDRKNELATENQKLLKKQGELESELSDTTHRLELLRQETEQTRQLSLAWQDFVSLYSPLKMLWADYVAVRMAPPRAAQILGDGTWPFTVSD